MSALTELQDKLAATRKQLVATDRDYRTARAQAGKPGARGTAAAATTVAQLQGERASQLAAEAALLAELQKLGDPMKTVGELDDGVPFLLFPVRLETRFMQIGTASELWLRIYPDDCQIQTSNEVMTDNELADLQCFWCEFWKAGGIEAQQRAAWTAFVNVHGSGRGSWLSARYRPTTTGPQKSDPSDLILVVNPTVILTPAETAAATSYWVAFWRAGTDAVARAGALAALTAAVGTTRVAQIQTGWAPHNLTDSPLAPATLASTMVSVVAIALPPTAGLTTSPTSWQQAPRVTTLPDCFVVTGLVGKQAVFTQVGKLIPGTVPIGPDPSLPDDEQIKSSDGELTLNKDLQWLSDFDAAIANGMAIKVSLTAAQYAKGFDQLVVLGLRLSANASQGATLLQTLLDDHRGSSSGLSVLPQGTPTNNTADDPSGYSWVDDPDESYDLAFGTATTFPLSSDPATKRDGQYLAEALGLAPASFAGIPHADGLDQAHARAMNTALWPTTWGYFLEAMMDPIVPADAVAHVRTFFIRYVSGRGGVPALRIGKQPYGILPTTVHSRLDFADHRPRTPPGPPTPIRMQPVASAVASWSQSFLDGLQKIVRKIDTDFASARNQVAFVGKAGDPLQIVLDVLGLHPASVEYYQRYAESVTQAYNEFSLKVGPFWAALVLGLLQTVRTQTLQGVGMDPTSDPPILEKIFNDAATQLIGPVVDDVPLSETAPIRAYSADGKNYLGWLAQSTLATIQGQDFGGKPAPTTLLYLLLRHASMLAYAGASVNLLAGVQLVDPATTRREADFIGVSTTLDGTSRWQYLENAAPKVTGDATTTVAQYLDRASVLALSPAATELREVKAALATLATASTGSLERLFAEHIDTCSYRIDAWKQSLVQYRADDLRSAAPHGIYLGAFGYVENLRPAKKPLGVAEVPPAIAPAFGTGRIEHDPANGGYIHAPSLNHATAAAVLKNAYLTHASPAAPGPMAVDLSSERVRLAMRIVEGVMEGQGLSELLGYQFEHGLHDRHSLDGVEAERFLYGLRCRFPLTASKGVATQPPAGTPIEQLESRNVVDGLALIEYVRTSGKQHYPFGLPTGTGAADLQPASVAEASAIDEEISRLEDAQDAVADLMMAESVYQAVQGQSARAAAASDVIGKGHYPSVPEVIRTPRSGTNLTHRVALHLHAGAVPSKTATPRAVAEPALDAWLSGRFPAMSAISCAVTWTDPAAGTMHSTVVTMDALGLSPIDLLYVAMLDGHASMTELDDRIAEHVRATVALHPGAEIAIQYTQPVPGAPSVFEVGALVRALHPLLLGARSLAANDLAPSAQGALVDPRWDLGELASRIGATAAALGSRVAKLAALAADATTAPEAYLSQTAVLLLDLAQFGIPQTGVGDWRAQLAALYASIATRVHTVLARWLEQRTECTALLASLPQLASDAARTTALIRAERLVATTPSTPPPGIAAYQPIVASALAAFDGARTALAAALATPVSSVAQLLSVLAPAIASIPTYDATPFDTGGRRNDLTVELAALTTLRTEIQARALAILADVQARMAAAATAVAQAQASTEPKKARALLTDAAQQVLGDAACVLPRFTVTSEHAGSLAAAYAGGSTLMSGLTSRAFPVDDWLYGAARVRAKLGAWERATLLAETFGAASAEFTPLQLPYADGDRWAALELPAGYVSSGDKLLYTAALPEPLAPAAAICGLVLDEWSEIIPGDSEVTGIAFHFGAPTTQAPQSILLATTPRRTGAWQWADLIDTITETIDQAKLRAIEPSQIAGSLYAQFVPATIMAVTSTLITISTNLADNLSKAAP